MSRVFFYTKNKACAVSKELFLLVTNLLLFWSIAYAQNLARPNIDAPAGLQVNSYTGSLFYQRTDMFIPARGISLQIAFSYNSAARATDYGFGYGWTINYNEFYKDSNNVVSFYRADGRVDNFGTPANAGGYLVFTKPVGIFDVVSKSGSAYTISQKDGTKYYFEDPASKKLTRILDRNGNEIKLAYSGSNLSSVSDGFGRSIIFSWNGNHISGISCPFGTPVHNVKYNIDNQGNLVGVADAKNQTIGYSYGADRVMTSVTDGNQNTTKITYNPNNAVNEIISCLATKEITYDSASNKVYVVDKTGGRSLLTTYSFESPLRIAGTIRIINPPPPRLVSRTGNCCGYSTKYTYDADNNITGITDANGNKTVYGYDRRGNLISETDALGKTIYYTYDATFNQVTSIVDKRGNKTVFIYDTKGNLLEKDMPLGIVNKYTYYDNGDRKTFTDGRNHNISYAYDDYGYLKTVTDSAGTTNYEFDIWGNLIAETDKNNHTTAYTYDAINQLTQKQDAKGNPTKYAYDANGKITLLTDGRGNTTSYEYDTYNNLIYAKDALGNQSAMNYDGMSKMTMKVDRNGHTTTYEYDNLNRLISEKNAAGEETQYTYDPNGNRISVTYPNGNTVNMQYDDLNRAIQISDGLGTISNLTYDNNSNKLTQTNALGNTTTYQYDALNRLVSEADPLGNSYNYQYDANNNLVHKTDRNGNGTAYFYNQLNWLTGTSDALSNITKYGFDATGNQTSVTDANNNTTSYQYDELNRKIQETYADLTTRHYSYDALSNLISRTDNNGVTTQYIYDKDNRLQTRQYPTTTDNFTYDAEGKMLSAINANATINFAYDVADRVTRETLNGKSTLYAYNIPNRIKTITYPGGRVVQRTMDVRSQLTNITADRKTIADFTYNAAGQNTLRSFGNGTSNAFNYNTKGLISSNNYNGGSNYFNDALDATYNYDKEDNPVYANHNLQASLTENYTDDQLNRLTGFTKGNNVIQQSFNYDGVGNRKTADSNGVTTQYTVNSMNAYTAITDGGKTINPVYDKNGNETNDGRNIYGYDDESRIINVNNGSTAKYVYDVLGRRIQKITATDTINYFFDGLQIVEERNEKDSALANYVWGIWVDDIVSMSRNKDVYYYNTNIVGSVNSITDTLGSIVEQYEYNAFGKLSIYNGSNILIASSAIGNTYSFTSRQYDAETRLYYYRVRYYDAVRGRFLERDPLGYIDGLGIYSYIKNTPIYDESTNRWLIKEPLTKDIMFNTYTYVDNAPLKKVDHLGLYGDEARFWADYNVNGNWWQKTISWPMLIFTAYIPDAAGFSISYTGGFLVGGTGGFNREWFRSECGHSDFLTHSILDPDGWMTPQKGLSVQFNLGWSSEYNPGASSWKGNFKESSGSYKYASGTVFSSDTWIGVGVGLNYPKGIAASSLNVDYTPVGSQSKCCKK